MIRKKIKRIGSNLNKKIKEIKWWGKKLKKNQEKGKTTEKKKSNQNNEDQIGYKN
jgi:hypothetical protein